jgi:hypothetical protein
VLVRWSTQKHTEHRRGGALIGQRNCASFLAVTCLVTAPVGSCVCAATTFVRQINFPGVRILLSAYWRWIASIARIGLLVVATLGIAPVANAQYAGMLLRKR